MNNVPDSDDRMENRGATLRRANQVRTRLLIGVTAVVSASGFPSANTAQEPPQIMLRAPNASYAGELDFERVTSMRELADGSILVADRAGRRILHIRWDGSEPRTVGRLGDGPGEYRQIGWLYALGGDSTLFTEEFSGRWLILRHNRIVSTMAQGGTLNQLLGGELSSGHHTRVLGLADASRRARADSLSLVRADLVSRRADTLARVRARGSRIRLTMLPPTASGLPVILTGNPLDTEEQALWFADDWIAIARLDPYRVDWRSPDGRWSFGSPLPYRGEPVDREERCWAIQRMTRNTAPCAVEERVADWPEAMPPFLPRGPTRALLPLLASPDGRLVIARSPSRGAPESRYDFIDRRGDRTGSLVLPPNEVLLGFGRASLYVLSGDADGVATVRRHPWP